MSKDSKSTYYDAGGIETLDIIRAKLTPEQYKGYLLGNVINYSCRMMHKTPEDPGRDAEKTANYSGWLRDELRTNRILCNYLNITKQLCIHIDNLDNACSKFNCPLEKEQKKEKSND